jgi:hypothetical protein
MHPQATGAGVRRLGHDLDCVSSSARLSESRFRVTAAQPECGRGVRPGGPAAGISQDAVTGRLSRALTRS